MTEHTAALERTVAAAPAEVWAAFTDPARLVEWFWPPRFATQARIAPVAGSEYRVWSDPAGMAVSGSVLTAHVPERLVLSWSWEGEPGETTAEITLAAVDGGTRIAVAHHGWPSADAAEQHRVGWSDCLDRLPAHLAA